VQRSTEILILLLIPNSNTLMLSVVRNVFVPLDHDALHYAEGAQFLCFKSSPSRAAQLIPEWRLFCGGIRIVWMISPYATARLNRAILSPD
jgi:hypothetical protein